MIPQWLEIGLMMAAWGIGFNATGWLADRYDEWIDSRRQRRARQMRDVTPGRV